MAMTGYTWTDEGAGAEKPEGGGGLAPWEATAVDAVGNVIEFWGFKRNQGRVWALLYLRGIPLSAQELEDQLDLSKGAVSMLVRDLERWGVILRVRHTGSSSWHYRAETDLIRMVTRVIEEREAGFISRIRADLSEARRLAGAAHVSKDKLSRLDRMNALATASEKAVRLFLRTARLDVAQMLNVFRS
jgi:DNA-binding transcriptional regulator GbsR (MarR family)